MQADGTRVPGYLGRVLAGDGVPAGTCFQVTAGLIVTAWHVLDGLGAGEAGARVDVDGLGPGSPVQPARVVQVDSLHDLAVLRVARPFAASIAGFRLSDRMASGARVRVLGVARLDDPGYDYRYAPAAGTWSGPAMREGGQVRLAVIDAKAVVAGMSGAPVRRVADDQVVGVISGRYNSADGWFRDSVWLARVEDLLQLLDGLAAIPADVHIPGDARAWPIPVGRVAAAGVLLVIAVVMTVVIGVIGIHWFSEPYSSSGHVTTSSSTGPKGLIATVTEPDGSTITSAAFSPSGTTLATADNMSDSTYLWNTANGNNLAVLPDPDNDSVPVTDDPAVVSVAFSPDRRTLAAGDQDGSIYLWNIADQHIIATLTEPPTGTLDAGLGLSLVDYSNDGTTLATVDGDTVYVWNVADRQVIAHLTDPTAYINSVAFSPDGTTLAGGGQDGIIYLWSIAGHDAIATLTDPSSDGINSVAFSPDGTTLAAGDGDDTTYVWNVADRQVITTLPDPGGDNVQPGVSCIAFSPDGNTLAVADGNSDSTYLWNVARKDITGTLNGSGLVAFSPDGKTLITSDNDTISLWNIARAQSP